MKREDKYNDYEGFVEKFKPKKTTDDCYTPPLIYEAVKDWVCKEYGVNEKKIVRPFYPGGDYEKFDYSDGKVVVDNPPLSILAKILDFYIEKNIPFFLFGGGLVLFSTLAKRKCCAIITDSNITYENGAKVKTGFLTNLDECKVRTSVELRKAIEKAQLKTEQSKKCQNTVTQKKS